jgi:hypothetical protein
LVIGVSFLSSDHDTIARQSRREANDIQTLSE